MKGEGKEAKGRGVSPAEVIRPGDLRRWTALPGAGEPKLARWLIVLCPAAQPWPPGWLGPSRYPEVTESRWWTIWDGLCVHRVCEAFLLRRSADASKVVRERAG